MKEINEEMMKEILREHCDPVDEFAADEIEVQSAIENGDIKYRSTCEYTMISPTNNITEDDDIFDYQGS